MLCWIKEENEQKFCEKKKRWTEHGARRLRILSTVFNKYLLSVNKKRNVRYEFLIVISHKDPAYRSNAFNHTFAVLLVLLFHSHEFPYSSWVCVCVFFEFHICFVHRVFHAIVYAYISVYLYICMYMYIYKFFCYFFFCSCQSSVFFNFEPLTQSLNTW